MTLLQYKHVYVTNYYQFLRNICNCMLCNTFVIIILIFLFCYKIYIYLYIDSICNNNIFRGNKILQIMNIQKTFYFNYLYSLIK